jgi:hypothetical protein
MVNRHFFRQGREAVVLTARLRRAFRRHDGVGALGGPGLGRLTHEAAPNGAA